MKRKAREIAPLLFLGLIVLLLAAGAAAQVKPQEVTFRNGKFELHGFLWKPDGPGPFPAILWNHGSEKLPGWRPELGAFYTAHNYVFFVPHRRGQGRSPGPYIEDLRMKAPPSQRNQRLVDLQEAAVEDVVAALNYLKSQPFVDRERIAMSGCSYGGIETLLAGERDLGVKALVPFAPAAMSWEGNSALQARLKQAVDHARAPVLLLQAENDFSLEPSRELTKEAQKKSADFKAKVYPAFGKSHMDGHGGFCATATNVWGDDVLAFIEAHWQQK
jgi:dienelactone hydrolase